MVPWQRDGRDRVLAAGDRRPRRRRPRRQTGDALRRRLEAPVQRGHPRGVDRLRRIADRIGTSVPLLAVAWTLAQEGVTGAICGASRPDQVDGWIGAADLVFAPGIVAEIESIFDRERLGLGAAISIHEGRPRISLDGLWKYRKEDAEPGASLGYADRDLDTSSWQDMELPTNWYLTEVGDFFGTVWFRRTFEVPATFWSERLFLRFGAVDYLADVWLNGVYLGSHEGMFNPFEFDVTDHVDLDGTNVVVVRDAAPRDDTDYVQVDVSDNPLSIPYRTHQARAIGQIKGHMIDAMHRPGSMTSFAPTATRGHLGLRRPHRTTERLRRPRQGVHEDRRAQGLARRPARQARRLRDRERGCRRAQHDRHRGGGRPPAHGGPAELRRLTTQRRVRRVALQPGRTTHKLVLTLPDARLWWTWDLGHPEPLPSDRGRRRGCRRSDLRGEGGRAR